MFARCGDNFGDRFAADGADSLPFSVFAAGSFTVYSPFAYVMTCGFDNLGIAVSATVSLAGKGLYPCLCAGSFRRNLSFVIVVSEGVDRTELFFCARVTRAFFLPFFGTGSRSHLRPLSERVTFGRNRQLFSQSASCAHSFLCPVFSTSSLGFGFPFSEIM